MRASPPALAGGRPPRRGTEARQPSGIAASSGLAVRRRFGLPGLVALVLFLAVAAHVVPAQARARSDGWRSGRITPEASQAPDAVLAARHDVGASPAVRRCAPDQAVLLGVRGSCPTRRSVAGRQVVPGDLFTRRRTAEPAKPRAP